MNIPELTKNTRKQLDITQEAFGAALSQKIAGDVSRQSVAQWEQGQKIPDRMFLILTALTYADWRRDWAQNCLATILPAVFAPAGTCPKDMP